MESLGDILKRLVQRSTSAATASPSPQEAQGEEGPACPICRGTGWVRSAAEVGHPDFGKARPCRCQQDAGQAQRLARLQRYSNMGLLTRLTFQGTEPTGRSPDPEAQRRFGAAYEVAREYAEDPKGWLLLTGSSGTGKTHLAAAVANRCMERSIPALLITVPDLLDHLRAAFAPGAEISYDETFEQVKNVPMLILDGLGTHSSTPWAEEKLYQVLNHRSIALLPTIITTSLDLSRLEERLRTRLEDPRLCRVLDLGQRAPGELGAIGELEPEMRARMTFATFDVRGNRATPSERQTLEAALRIARSFAKDPDGWLVLLGETGRGKTHLAVAIANERLQVGQPVYFANVPELLDHLRSTFSPESRVTYDSRFEEVKRIPLLVLDDLGAETTTPWAREKLYQIIVHRHNARLPTIITTRKLPDDPADPIASRMNDPKVVAIVAIRAPDYRSSTQRHRPRQGA
ncbi:MAG: ATP-binding protein [Chloroflexi bacterium]|nr:ATP-binding protein [Chloroflexota bacterium]